MIPLPQAPVPSYRKVEYRVPMRDGARLHTVVYLPAGGGPAPILMERTPYSAGPYGARTQNLAGDPYAARGYILVTQDVRGRYLSEGVWENVRPLTGGKGVDDATDTYDTIDFLLKTLPNNNGRVGMRGISYPGFYAAVGGLSMHPALKAISPQAPVADWWRGDDVRHNGAFFVQDNWDFSEWFDVPRKGLEEDHEGLPAYDRGPGGAYGFFLRTGNSANLGTEVAKGRIPYWAEIGAHPDEDAYWRARAIPEKLKALTCSVLTVGGWFDGEDLWGALNVHKGVRAGSPKISSSLVMGPWSHGAWAGGTGDRFSAWTFARPTAREYRETIEEPFFRRTLEEGVVPPSEARIFFTGSNSWRTYPSWPPATKLSAFALAADGTLGGKKEGSRSWHYDPAAPTPYVADWKTSKRRPAAYMGADEQFLDGRKDLAVWTGARLKKPMTVAGPVDADLWMTTTGTDMDVIVKVFDVDEKGVQRLLRWEVLRGRYRDSSSKPSPFVPGIPTRVRFALNDVAHTFLPGHRMMVRVQSSMFPLIERHPNTYVDVFSAPSSAYRPATIAVLNGPKRPSRIVFGTLPR